MNRAPGDRFYTNCLSGESDYSRYEAAAMTQLA